MFVSEVMSLHYLRHELVVGQVPLSYDHVLRLWSCRKSGADFSRSYLTDLRPCRKSRLIFQSCLTTSHRVVSQVPTYPTILSYVFWLCRKSSADLIYDHILRLWQYRKSGADLSYVHILRIWSCRQSSADLRHEPQVLGGRICS